MKLNITTRTSGLQDFRHRFKAISQNTTAQLNILGKEEVQNVQERIATTKMTPDGQAWRPWSMATRRMNARRGNRGRGLLYRTGRLFKSIKYKLSPKTLTVYSSIPYAKYLQNGTNRMPARQFLGWSQMQLNRIKDIMKGALE